MIYQREDVKLFEGQKETVLHRLGKARVGNKDHTVWICLCHRSTVLVAVTTATVAQSHQVLSLFQIIRPSV